MALKADAAELVVDRPFPCCVGVTVEDDAALDFARALLDSGDIVTDLFGEEEVNELDICAELHQCNKETEYDKDSGDYGQTDKKQHDSKQHACQSDVKPAVE